MSSKEGDREYIKKDSLIITKYLKEKDNLGIEKEKVIKMVYEKKYVYRQVWPPW